MTESSPKWRSLHVYQKIKYFAEILAICGGLVLLALNVHQVRLLSESNEINRRVYNSTFPVEIQSALMNYVDGNPLVIRLRLTNVIGRRMQLRTWMARVVRMGSNTVEDDFGTTTIDLFKAEEKMPTSPTGAAGRKITLKASESCILKISTKLDVRAEYSEKDIFRRKPEQTAFLAIPVSIESFGQSASKIILLSLSRDKDGSLLVTPDILRDMNNDTLMQIVRIMRAQLSVPHWDELK